MGRVRMLYVLSDALWEGIEPLISVPAPVHPGEKGMMSR